MAYGGQNFIPSALSSYNVGEVITKKEEKHRSSSGLTSFFRILIVIAEVGASLLLPGVGEGMAAGAIAANLAGQVGIGLAAAGAQTGISAAEGTMTGIGIGIDFASAFIPLGGAFRTAGKLGKATTSLEANASKEALVGRYASEIAKHESKISKLQEQYAAQDIRKATALNNKVVKAQKKMANFYKRVSSGRLTESDRIIIDNWEGLEYFNSLDDTARMTAKMGSLGRELPNIRQEMINEYAGMARSATAKLQRAEKVGYNGRKGIAASRRAIAEAKQEMKELMEAFEAMKDIPWIKRITKSSFVYEAEKLFGPDKRMLIEELYLNPLKRAGSRQFKKARSQALYDLYKMNKKLSPKGQEVVSAMIRHLKHFHYTKNKMTDFVEKILTGLGKRDAAIVAKEMGTENFLRNILLLGKRSEKGIYKFVKKAGSQSFNDNYVQTIQAVFDANDAGRMPIELAYKFLKKKIDAYFVKKSAREAKEEMAHVLSGRIPAKGNIRKGLGEKIGKGAGDTHEMAQAFRKAGGKIIYSQDARGGKIYSRYLLGLKVLPNDKIHKKLCLLKFNPIYTNGKKDVLIWATDEDIEGLLTNGSSYYWDEGFKKGWYKSRGGRRVTGGFASISTELSLFLGFVPIPALRNVLSIVSNIVESVNDMFNGSWTKNYIAKFERALVRSSVNRTGRLLSRAVVGGAAATAARRSGRAKVMKITQAMGAKDVTNAEKEALKRMLTKAQYKAARGGQWVGRELQRTTTTILSNFEGQDKNGFFAWTKGSTRTRSTAQNLAFKFLTTALPTSAKGAGVRAGTRGRFNRAGQYRKHQAARQLIGAKRNLSQLGRVYSAFTPAGVGIPSLRKLTKFR